MSCIRSNSWLRIFFSVLADPEPLFLIYFALHYILLNIDYIKIILLHQSTNLFFLASPLQLSFAQGLSWDKEILFLLFWDPIDPLLVEFPIFILCALWLEINYRNFSISKVIFLKLAKQMNSPSSKYLKLNMACLVDIMVQSINNFPENFLLHHSSHIISKIKCFWKFSSIQNRRALEFLNYQAKYSHI